MKKGDWIIALSFIVMGFCCLTVSAVSWFQSPYTIQFFTNKMLIVCLFAALLIGAGTVIYYLMKQRRKR
ncbi:hypothetical protein [Paenibacillus agricola]|uniref:Uncharacterized protein n=1 Tax=Paenibacillus agricola TaxID=2716264 RepID=A0ABX0JF06_9BACL|nr:hypothetical protein [Paenibacillus agricola]NHN33283.1 hypothetical protein [Paenibacillus agricola]